MPVVTDLTQLQLFMDFVEKTAHRECPGGLKGCALNGESDMRCRLGPKYFLDKHAVTTDRTSQQTTPSFFLFVNLLFFVVIN